MRMARVITLLVVAACGGADDEDGRDGAGGAPGDAADDARDAAADDARDTNADDARDAAVDTGDASRDVGMAEVPAGTSLVAIAPELDGWCGQQGQTSHARVVIVTNVGAVTTGLLAARFEGPSAARFVLVRNDCTQPLAPMQSCSLSVSFRPTDLGVHAATLIVAGTPGGEVALTVQARAVPVGGWFLEPRSVSFDAIAVGEVSAGFSVRVPNDTKVAANVSARLLGSDAAEFAIVGDDCSGKPIAPGEACFVAVRFAPRSAGAKTASLQFRAEDTCGDVTATIQLNGVAVTARLQATPSAVDFACVPLDFRAASRTVTVQNTGARASGPVVARIEGDGTPFEVEGTTCGASLAPAATCTVTVQFAPTKGGPASAALTVSSAGGAAVSVPLSGTGAIAGDVFLDKPSHQFGEVAVGTRSAVAEFRFPNYGSQPAMVSFTLGGANAGDYRIVEDLCTGRPVAPMSSCPVTVQFAPTSPGAKNAALVFTGAGAGACGGFTGSATLVGTGTM